MNSKVQGTPPTLWGMPTLVSLFFLICLILSSEIALADEANNLNRHAVNGTVVSSEDGLPLLGVNILVKGTSSGTITDIDGTYSIDTPTPNDTLIFSYIGYLSVEVPINGRSEIDVVMELDQLQLDAVVVTGYTTQRKRDLTGAVGVG